MLILLEIPYKKGIILSQKGVQANHMIPSVSANVEAIAMHYKQGNKFI